MRATEEATEEVAEEETEEATEEDLFCPNKPNSIFKANKNIGIRIE